MSSSVLKDQMGRILGTVTVDRNGIQTLKSSTGIILGTYDPKTNVTKNYLGQIIGSGNVLSMLLSR
jgi:hypothetical protein